VIDDDQLRDLAPLISMVWLFDILPRMLEPVAIPTLHNADGEEVVFHRVRFPFTRGTTQALIGDRLDTVPALQRETSHFWNWLGTRTKQGKTGQMAGVSMEDGAGAWESGTQGPRSDPLRHLGRTCRTRRCTRHPGARRPGGNTLTEIETIEQAMAARQEGRTVEPAPDIPVEVATPLVHGMLDRQYRTLLDEPSRCSATKRRDNAPAARPDATNSPRG
jgi:hypothetical protein